MRLFKEIFELLVGLVTLISTTTIALGRLGLRWLRKLWNTRRAQIGKGVFYGALSAILLLLLYTFIDTTLCRDYYDYYISDRVMARYYYDTETTQLYDSKEQRDITDEIGWVSDVSGDAPYVVYAIPHRRGYINIESGEIAIDAKDNNYTNAWVFSEGLAAVVKEGKVGFINEHNEVKIPFQYDYTPDKCDMCDIGFVFHNGQCVMINAEGKVGIINTQGEWIVEPQYDEVWCLQDTGYRNVVLNRKYGVLDKDGKVVYPTEYGYIGQLNDGFELTKGGRMWKEDFEGNVVIPFMVDGTYYLKYPNGYDEFDEITYTLSDYVMYEVLNCYGIMNRITGEPITLAIYSDINMLSEGVFEVQEYDSYEYYHIDTEGNLLVGK